MTIEMMSGYRATMFDGDESVDWLRHGWRALRFYARKAKDAINNGDAVMKAIMIERANRLLTIMSGILDTSEGTTLGPAMMNIYNGLGGVLLRANLTSSTEALDDFERAVEILAKEILGIAEASGK
jgi:flagellin-specific chaperone FliS